MCQNTDVLLYNNALQITINALDLIMMSCTDNLIKTVICFFIIQHNLHLTNQQGTNS